MSAILVIDDNVEFANILDFALSASGYEVLVANGSARGLALIKERPVKLVITDVIMPEKDGIETLLSLRKEQPDLPVIVMSGDSPRHAALYLTAAEKLGAKRTLLKPFTMATLLASVEGVLAETSAPGLTCSTPPRVE